MERKAIILGGPTGVGKTSLSISLAKEFKADIISADSAQVYRGLDIGTAKIKKEEMEGVTHHLLNVIEPIRKYSVGEFAETVNTLLQEKYRKKKIFFWWEEPVYIYRRSVTVFPPCLLQI
ncbi:hypothetical protein HMPREF9466_00555 [Fusobacterium necrophorum subsp. funduliforme 1_1_36S]|nr:hypothetical protein HMPREF9466_00555 [Fusobacterium necrophorum subsp. funduliforme 1_1_36S]